RLSCAPRDGDAGNESGESQAPRIFLPHLLAERTTQWERGADPMTRFTFATDYDEYGQARRQTAVACPRGWRTMADAPAAAYIAMRTRTDYARVSDPQVYIKDRVVRTTTWDVTATAGQTVPDLRDLPDDDARLEISSQTLFFYDGDLVQPGGRA